MVSLGIILNIMCFIGVQLVVYLLECQGIIMVSGILGGFILFIYDVLSQSMQICYILVCYEQGVGFIVQGMVCIEGKLVVCMVCSGLGVMNLVMVIVDVCLDLILLVCIIGQVLVLMIGIDVFQEVDIYGIFIFIIKYNYLVCDIVELLQVISDVFCIVQFGCFGLVWIDIFKDVQLVIIELEVLFESGECVLVLVFVFESVCEVVVMINVVKCLVLYLGGGVINVLQVICELVEKVNLLIIMILMVLGMLLKVYLLLLGMLGMYGVCSINFILQEVDLLIVLGVCFDDWVIGKIEQFCLNVKIIYVDIDCVELGKIK